MYQVDGTLKKYGFKFGRNGAHSARFCDPIKFARVATVGKG